MKRAISAIVIFVTFFAAGIARAQESFWVQVEANATLREAETAAQRYASRLGNVNGFRLGASGWYAIALGPYTEAAATQRLLTLRAQGTVPGDSYVAASGAYSQQFWPVGANALNEIPVAAPEADPVAEPVTDSAVETAQPAAEATPEPAQEVAVAPTEPPEETRAEALRSERDLDRDQKKELQVAMQWEGFYKSLIDGDFGPGTRAAMAAWQEAKGFEATGVLTTRQRAALLGDYQAVLDSMGLALVTDSKAGIEVVVPTAMVGFDRYEAPFAHYQGDDGARVVLISQQGGKATLYGLYDILQTLEVVPAEGERRRRDSDFTIEGADDEIVSYTYAKLTDGAVKGFMLIWPQGARQVDAETGDVSFDLDRRRGLVLEAMRQSFASTGEIVLDDNAGLDVTMQSIDLVSGLEIRRADRARSGFWVTAQGAVLTTKEAVEGCERITLNESYDATVTAVDDALGAVLLTPTRGLAPISVAEFLTFDPRLQSNLAVAGYSYGGKLSSPTLTFGTLADVRGLGGEDNIARLAIKAQDGDAGGPVLDQGGAVVGMLMSPPGAGDRQLPGDVAFVAKAVALADFLAANGVTATPTEIQGAMAPYDLAALAANMTVLVSCWK